MTTEKKMKKPVIICVDDEQMILNSLNKQLQRKFGDRFEYEFAESAEEALEIINELAEDGYTILMIITDQIMPGMTGDKFLINVHEKHPKPIKILLTGQAAIESAINAVNKADLYRYMTKPWDEEDFLLTIEKGLQQYYLMDEMQKQVEVFQKFVPKEFLQFLGKESILDVGLGDQVQREMTIMFTDIRQFTTLSEKMTPNENFNFINSYLGRVGPVIHENRGFIDKYIGDAIMSLFPYQAEDAVKSAVQMQKAVEIYNEHRKKQNYSPITIGIGLHTGSLMLGTIGDDQRMQSTVISDAVNLASRMEGLTKWYGASIVASEYSLSKLNESKSKYNSRLLGKIQVKGKKNNIWVYEIFDGDVEKIVEFKLKTKTDFENGMNLYYERKFAEASVQLNSVLKVNPEDKVARLYLQRAAYFMVNGVADGWEGVEEMTEK
jgi:two-component system sensor histidine kinase ChiS